MVPLGTLNTNDTSLLLWHSRLSSVHVAVHICMNMKSYMRDFMAEKLYFTLLFFSCSILMHMGTVMHPWNLSFEMLFSRIFLYFILKILMYLNICSNSPKQCRTFASLLIRFLLFLLHCAGNGFALTCWKDLGPPVGQFIMTFHTCTHICLLEELKIGIHVKGSLNYIKDYTCTTT